MTTMLLGLTVGTAHADGCHTPESTVADPPEVGRLVSPIGSEVPLDGAFVWEESLGPDEVVVFADGVPLELEEELAYPLARLVDGAERSLRVLRPAAPLEPGQVLVVEGPEVGVGPGPVFRVTDATAAPPPAFEWVELLATSWVDPDAFDGSTYTPSCNGPRPLQRQLTFRFVPPADGVEAYAVIHEVDDEETALDAPSWGWLAVDEHDLQDVYESAAGPCFVGRWLGASGDLGPPSEPICVPPEPVADTDGAGGTGSGCATAPAPAGVLAAVGALLVSRRRSRAARVASTAS